jgi:hypothetical protein
MGNGVTRKTEVAMLLLKAVLTGLVSGLWIYSPAAGSTEADVSNVSQMIGVTHGYNQFVRIQLAEEMRVGSIASVSLPAGSDQVTIKVKRSALAPHVLAAAFSVLSSLAPRRVAHPTATVVVYIPEALGARALSPANQVKFEALVAQLRSQPPGSFLEVNEP